MRFPTFGRKSRPSQTAPMVRPPLFPDLIRANWNANTGPMRSYEALVRDAYLRNPIAQRAVRIIAEGAAGAPVRSNPPDHPVLRLLGGGEPGPSLIETVAANLILHGNAYIEVGLGASGLPSRSRATPLEHEQSRVIGQLVGVMREQLAYDPPHGFRGIETARELDPHQLCQPLDAEKLSIGGAGLHDTVGIEQDHVARLELLMADLRPLVGEQVTQAQRWPGLGLQHLDQLAVTQEQGKGMPSIDPAEQPGVSVQVGHDGGAEELSP